MGLGIRERLVRDLSAAWRQLILLSQFAAGYFSTLIVTARLTNESQGSFLFAMPIYIGEAVFCYLVHEFGHAAAAKMVGWRVHLIAVGSIAYMPKTRRFEWVGRPQRRGLGGRVVAFPPVGSSWSKRSSIALLLGGPLANFALGVAVAPFIPALLDPTSHPWWEAYFGSLCVVSCAIGAANLLPFSMASGRRSDGAQLLARAFGAGPTPAKLQCQWLYSQHLDGIPAANWDLELVKNVEDVEPNSPQGALRDWLLMHRYLTMADLPNAYAITSRRMQGNDEKPSEWIIEHAFLVALVDHDGVRAQQLLDQVSKNARKSFQYWRAMAVAAYHAGDVETARNAVANANSSAQRKKTRPDQDDHALFDAIRGGQPLPVLVARTASP